MNLKLFIENQKVVGHVPRLERSYLLKYWEAIGKTFDKSYQNDQLTEKFINYFCIEREHYYPALIDNHKKGLFIYGNKGLGKSLNFLIYSRLLLLSKHKLWEFCQNINVPGTYKDERFFHFEDIKDTEIAYKRDNVKHFEFLTSKRELVIDDIGTEPLNNKDYGTDMNLVADIIRLRYNKSQKGYSVTHITTNLDKEQIKERYGDRIADRMNEMFIPILVTGESKRH